MFIAALATNARPALSKFVYYAKVELVPPKISDIPAIRSGITNLFSSIKNRQFLQLTVREVWLNTLVGIEIYCWFFVGECIGKRHLIGYKV
ncbi:ATP synthase subunit g, mitochondrial [Habropoda laboriosa]|uniref:ATP synthase subunit g, mitochondrial n=1 Tax=Habropoda laboriosa TaxID=597456 RepID=A0A0L7RFF8_9HYME|nr:ATP synthase subunit g, mitochondrial [Habropoda laboriosa]